LFYGGHDPIAASSLQPVGITQSFLLTPPDTTSNCTPCPWTAGPNMGFRRWYPTATMLHDGRVVATSGWEFGRGGDPPVDPTAPDPTFGPDIAEVPEVYNPISGSGWDSLSSAVKLDVSLYPAMYVDPSPNGTRLLYVGPGAAPHDPNGVFPLQDIFRLDVATEAWSDVASRNLRGFPAVMYGVQSGEMKILKTGGITPSQTVTNAAHIIGVNLTSGNVSVATANPMLYARVQHQLTVLPDGTVLATGGTTSISWRCPNQFRRAPDRTVESEPRSARLLERARDDEPSDAADSSDVPLDRDPPAGRPGPVGGRTEPHHLSRFLGRPLPKRRHLQSSLPVQVERRHDHVHAASFDQRGRGAEVRRIRRGDDLRRGRRSRSQQHRPHRAHPARCRHALAEHGAALHPLHSANGDFTFVGGTVNVPANKMPSSRLAPPGYYMLFLVNNDTPGRPSKASFVNLWGIVESSVQVAVTQSCQAPRLTFDVQWDGTVPGAVTDGPDSVQVYAPGPACSGSPANTASLAAPAGSFHHHLVVTVPNMCASGTWTVRVRSRKGTSSVSTYCASVSVTCISCQPPPCGRPPCEIE
jgi:hypothetical protein